MQDYTIGENYTLPSLGKIYNVEVNPDIRIRSMTTEEEMKRVAATDQPYKNMSEIIDDCIVGDMGISSYDLCIGDYQYLLHKLRIVTYGPDYQVANQCIYCGCETEESINLEELPILQYSEDYEKLREFDLPKSGTHIKLRPQTPRMLDIINDKLKEYKKKTKGAGVDQSLVFTLAELIEAIDGKKPNPVKIESWIRKLPMADTNTIVQHADKMNNSIGVSTSITVVCDVCGLDYKTNMRTTAEFFRPTLNI